MSYQEDRFTEIANAIRAQIGGGEIQATQFASKIGLINSDDAYTVRFIDYDGTVLKEQIVAPGESVTPPTMTDKPATSIRPALTFQGWNHPQSELNSVSTDIDCGAIYVPTDGKTHIYLRLNPTTGYAIPINIAKSDTSLMTIDWGDGTTKTNSTSGNLTFTTPYASVGLKHITIAGSNYKITHGSQPMVGGTSQAYKDALFACYVGSGATHLQVRAFYGNRMLRYITLPNGITISGVDTIFSASGILHISVPQGVTSLVAYFANDCMAMRSISLPYGITTIAQNSLQNCSALEYIAIPSTTTTIGAMAAQNCYSQRKILLPSATVSIGGQAFQGANGANIVKVNGNITTFGDQVFQSNFQAKKIDFTTIKSLFFSAAFTFYQDYSADDEIQVPSGTTSLGMYLFCQNYSRTFFDIPSSVNAIGSYCFNRCSGLKYMILRPTTPPALADTAALANIPVSVVYFVPDASLAAYQTATNWATYSNQIRPLSEFNINDFQ